MLESVCIFQTGLDKSSFSSESGIFNEKFSKILEHCSGHVKYAWRQGWASCRTAPPSCCSQIVCSGTVETQPGEGLSSEDGGRDSVGWDVGGAWIRNSRAGEEGWGSAGAVTPFCPEGIKGAGMTPSQMEVESWSAQVPPGVSLLSQEDGHHLCPPPSTVIMTPTAVEAPEPCPELELLPEG